MTVLSLTWRGHSRKVTWNTIAKFAYRCFQKGLRFSKLFQSFILDFHIWNKNDRSNDFLFLNFHFVMLFNSSRKQLLRIFLKFSNKLTVVNNVIEFMFSNTSGKQCQGPFVDNFMELLEKVNSRVLVTDCFWTC